ncbi:MAG: tryptophan--tRNA ligase [Candidatus Eremiobacteraeota bacterium]|nr:tryptophan--tRNA ligase [Candidatus Eremiobacteraeota bacterium]MBC5820767.1 tryptophan--tRNA ligase [Candidatus Eremiobacteraeota bacterium]
MRPTGRLHLGHLVGALSQWIAFARDNETFYEVADLHALTTSYERTTDLAANVREVVLGWLATGVDPTRSTLYVQSHVPQISELHLLLSMLVPVAWLQRVPTFKDQINALGPEIATYGFLGYPLLQLVDVAVMRGDTVPVGKDQLSHLELGREVVRRFNNTYGRVLIEPQATLSQFPDVPGLDGRKMSKSYGNTIDLADDAATTTKKVRTMVTDPLKIRRHDPGRPEVCPVYALHHIADPALVPMVAEGCRSGALGCVDCKGQLAERLNAYLQPVRERRTELEAIDVDGILADGAQRAREVASATLADVKRAMRV